MANIELNSKQKPKPFSNIKIFNMLPHRIKNNEFYFENRTNLIIEHTYDWYGRRNWTELLRHE